MARISDPAILVPHARNGDRRSLARLITIVENGDYAAAGILEQVFSSGGTAWTTGFTGAPGAGKSTLTDQLIARIRRGGDEVAVVAVDPSSPFTGGAVLGDRVRMQGHVDDPGVYIRSMASRGHLGGIAAATPRVVSLLDGIGFPEVMIETVGVGQDEVEVAGSADTTVVVVNPGWGDSVQAAKAGLLEIGDVFVVNKSDRPGVAETIRDLTQMLELGGVQEWQPPIVPTVATTGKGIQEMWEAIAEHRIYLQDSGRLTTVRRERLVAEMDAALLAALQARVRSPRLEQGWSEMVDRVRQRNIDPWSAAAQLLEALGVPSE